MMKTLDESNYWYYYSNYLTPTYSCWKALVAESRLVSRAAESVVTGAEVSADVVEGGTKA